MNDLTLHHRVPHDWRNAPSAGPCVWCGKPSVVTALTPGKPELGRLPLHLTCGPVLRDAFRAWQAGHVLGPEDQAGMARFQAAMLQLGSGQ